MKFVVPVRGMSPGMATALMLGLLAGAAGSAQGQNCIWTVHQTGVPTNQGAAVYDSGNGRVLYVDSGEAASPSLWAWDGTSWTIVASVPFRRQAFAMVYDAARSRLVLSGGLEPGFYPVDTWEWDGTSWMRVAASGPGGRIDHSMVYDERRHRTMVYGGWSLPSGDYHDTWEWDGASWMLAASTGPTSSFGRVAYDSLRGRSVLLSGNTLRQELWEWDGAAWMQRPDPPQSGLEVWMVYDRARARMVVGRWNNTASVSQVDTFDFEPLTGDWTLRTPGVLVEGPMAYDAGRERTVGVGYSTYEFDGAATVVPPAVLRQPASGSYRPGDTIALWAQCAGTGTRFQWFKGSTPLQDGGRISGATTAALTILQAETGDTGAYKLTVSNMCWSVDSAAVNIDVSIPTCYANCDGSTTPPVLNVNDFICFLNKFQVHDPYADCDHSQLPPPFNINDFICFQTKFAQGCP